MSTSAPETKTTDGGLTAEVMAQLACILGSEGTPGSVEQLQCFNPFILALWFNRHPPFSQWTLPAGPSGSSISYPYITGGRRKCSIDTSATRTSAWDTSCSWTFEFDGSQDMITVWLDASNFINIPNSFSVQIQATLEIAQRDRSTVSQQMKTLYGLNQNDLDNHLFDLYVVQIVPTSVTNDLQVQNVDAVNTAIKTFLQQDEASLFCPCIFQQDLSFLSRGGPVPRKQRVAIAMGSPYGKKNWNRLYVVKLLSGGPTNPPAQPDWIQDWALQDDTQDCTMVLAAWAWQYPLMFQLGDAQTASFMNSIVTSWPRSSDGVTVAPSQYNFHPWDWDNKQGDFAWKPGTEIPDADTEASVPFAGNSSNFFDANAQIDNQSATLVTRNLTRQVDWRMYFVPGYTDEQGNDIGPRLPMQNYMDLPPAGTAATTNTGPKWQVAVVGKNAMTWSIAYEDISITGGGMSTSANGVFEVSWMMYFSFREFVGQLATFTASEVASNDITTSGSAPPGNPDFLTQTMAAQSKQYKTWLQKSGFVQQLGNAVTLSTQINVPVAAQLQTGRNYLSNAGDLLVTFTYT